MKIKQIGLNTILVTFSLKEKKDFILFKEINKDAFIINEIFINNGLGYELNSKFFIDKLN